MCFVFFKHILSPLFPEPPGEVAHVVLGVENKSQAAFREIILELKRHLVLRSSGGMMEQDDQLAKTSFPGVCDGVMVVTTVVLVAATVMVEFEEVWRRPPGTDETAQEGCLHGWLRKVVWTRTRVIPQSGHEAAAAPTGAGYAPFPSTAVAALTLECVLRPPGVQPGDVAIGGDARVLSLQLPINTQPTALGHLVHCEYRLHITLKAEGRLGRVQLRAGCCGGWAPCMRVVDFSSAQGMSVIRVVKAYTQHKLARVLLAAGAYSDHLQMMLMVIHDDRFHKPVAAHWAVAAGRHGVAFKNMLIWHRYWYDRYIHL